MQIWAESGKSALPICNYSQILYQFLTFTQNLKRSLFSFLQSLPNTLPSLSPCQFQFHPEYSVLRSKVQNPKLQLWWYQGCMSQALGLLSDEYTNIINIFIFNTILFYIILKQLVRDYSRNKCLNTILFYIILKLYFSVLS